MAGLPDKIAEAPRRAYSALIESVSVEFRAPPEQVEQVREAFRRAGFEVELRDDFIRRGAQLLPWEVSVVLVVPIAEFFRAFTAEAGKDAYAAVRA